MNRRAATPGRTIARFANQVAARIDAVVQRLEDVASDAPSDGGAVEHFRSATRRLLATGDDDDVLAGSGFAACYDGRERLPAMVWWARRGDALVERSHSVDPDSESFYDYAALRWFRVPVGSGEPTLTGPFIDTWGADDYTVTVSLPVTGVDGPVGVVAADVDVRRFIASLITDLRGVSAPVALVNEFDRVVVSTAPTLSTGLPLRPRGATVDESEDSQRQRVPVPGFAWSVVLAPS